MEVYLPGFGLPGVAGIALVGVGTVFMAAMHFGTLDGLVALLLVELARCCAVADFLRCIRSAAKGDMGEVQAGAASERRADAIQRQENPQLFYVGHEGEVAHACCGPVRHGRF